MPGMPVRVWFEQDNEDKGSWFRGRVMRVCHLPFPSSPSLPAYGDGFRSARTPTPWTSTWWTLRTKSLRLSLSEQVLPRRRGNEQVEMSRLYPLPRSVAHLPPLGLECVTAPPRPVPPAAYWRETEHDPRPPRHELWNNYNFVLPHPPLSPTHTRGVPAGPRDG